MGSRVDAVIVTPDGDAATRLSQLLEGSAINVLGSTALTERGLRKIAKRPPPLILFEGDAAGEDSTSFLRALSIECPHSRTIVLSGTSDIGFLARVAIAHAYSVIPSMLPRPLMVESLVACAKGGTPEAGAAYARVAEALDQHRKDASSEPDAGNAVTACLQLGLSPEETARFLGLAADSLHGARDCASPPTCDRTLARSVSVPPKVIGIAVCVLAILSAGIYSTNRSAPTHFRGRIVYPDNRPLPCGSLRLEFWPQRMNTLSAPIGRADTERATGVFYGVVPLQGNSNGIPAGVYRVTLSLPSGAPVPPFLAGSEYSEPKTTPLACDTNDGLVLLTVNKPSELAAVCDSNHDGVVDVEEGEAAVARAE